jgi:hypothetical protein
MAAFCGGTLETVMREAECLPRRGVKKAGETGVVSPARGQPVKYCVHLPEVAEAGVQQFIAGA